MESKYHKIITKSCFESWFSETALQAIIKANIKQDRVTFLLGHDYIHFDGSAFKAGFEYIDDQFLILYESIKKTQPQEAWAALGHISHSWQDFYSHSNYVLLWINKNNSLDPHDISPDDQGILTHTQLISGKNYGLIEFLSMIPVIKKLILPLMPEDSHAKMNLDNPQSSPLFSYAFQAALKRTEMILISIETKLADENIDDLLIHIFRGYPKLERRYNQNHE